MKTFTLSEWKDKHVGPVGIHERDRHEYELRMELLGHVMGAARKERNLTLEEPSKPICIQKSQISKPESSANSPAIDTTIKVFAALKAEINFDVILENSYLRLA